MENFNLNFNFDWEFKIEGETEWKKISIPHDWLIGDVKNLYKNSVGLYRKFFELKNFSSREKIFLRFDGVYQDCDLHVNGKKVGEWKHGYTAFEFEITEFLREEQNEILVTVRHESPNSRWYSGAGIFRDVTLIRKNAAHFKRDGIYVTPYKDEKNNWKAKIETEVEADEQEYEIKYFFAELPCNDGIYKPIELLIPRVWDINDPVCYMLKCELLVNGEVVDTAHTRFGFREINFTPEKFFLNGRHVPIRGVCQHHDLGGLGAAFHKDAARRQLQILREMGVNAIRTAHNPPAAAFMELCDEMGFLVMSEFTDMWLRPKTNFDYARFFDEWVERDVSAWIRRDRNCPSIIMWSVGNEIYDTHADPELGLRTLKRLICEVKKHDPNNHAFPTLCSNYMAWEPTQKCADEIKLIGYNYAERLYSEHKSAHPDWIIYGGETASTVQSRGVYHFPFAKPILCEDDEQCSSLGNSTTSWGARSTEAVIRDHENNLGQFIWTG
ncbi:MAG: glycoside hydrolase family 2, partial [Defluviitaleaceae bacterium]|nr:glycoside hydrolase family 2 [Defluviitaleaceae bacterium]